MSVEIAVVDFCKTGILLDTYRVSSKNCKNKEKSERIDFEVE